MPSPAAHRSSVLGRARVATAWLAAASLAGVGLFSGLAALRQTASAASTSSGSGVRSRPAKSSSLTPATTAPSSSSQPAHVSSGGTGRG
ncbi:MAG TPA: hypothetical protein VKV06_03780 [Acidimicrobiales bacterium]|nr:hypothetical protein [Acidimicrobiales bacterium]